jgi:hypothetical protein
VQLLLLHPDVTVNTVNEDGHSPLLAAANLGRDACVQLLLAHPNINVNMASKDGLTPLSASTVRCASRESPLRCLVLLLASHRVARKCIEETVKVINKCQNDPTLGGDARLALPVLEAELRGKRRWCAYCYAVKEKGTFSVCARCQQVGYCSPEHQKAHWKAAHKHQCTAAP